MPDISWLFHAIVATIAVVIPTFAWAKRGRPYGIFSALLLCFSLPGAVVMHARLAAWVGDGAIWVSAVFALLMNLVMIMGALAFAQAQLSLPGIAGLILTVGMAVDANILVFERIREERKLGKSLLQAVKSGYDRISH